MDTLKCPVCGEVNPANAEFCQNCMSRLKPLTGSLAVENAALQPGQVPTKKVTAELEPILPQWLREAREKARQSATEESSEPSLPASANVPTTPATPDLLAGLASQSSDEEEEVPDWLTSFTGNAPAASSAKQKRVETEADDTKVKWVELGSHDLKEPSSAIGATQLPSEAPAENTTPSWMMPQEPAPEKDELADWLSHADEKPAAVSDLSSAASVQPSETAPSIFSSSTSEDGSWLKNLESKPMASASTPELMAKPKDSEPAPQPESTFSSSNDLPDWLKNLQTQQPSSGKSPSSPAPEEQPVSQPDWLQSSAPAQNASVPSAEVPDWLKAFGEAPATAIESNPSSSDSSNVPDWLKTAAPQPSMPTPSAPAPDVEKEPAAPTETPDWLSRLKPEETQPPDEPTESKVPAFVSQETSELPASSASAFVDSPREDTNVDDIFASIQIPDWLVTTESKKAEQASAEPGSTPVSPSAGESITPAELPSWVQAMRPVESASTSASTSGAGSFMESGGPLAGLQNVLPVGPGFHPTSKPKAYSIKVNATDEHQTQSALLEKILAAETSPIPMKAASTIASQRALRWAITILVLLLVGVVFFFGTQNFFTTPALTLMSNDQTRMAILAIGNIPQGAPVLAVFDYEPSLSGELQTVAEPYLSRMLLLKHPLLTILSTSPTGPALAEELMNNLQSGPLPISNYQRGKQYVDLGYLPGGLAGVYDFAQDPKAAIPLGADGSDVWQTPPLKDVTNFSKFAAIILLTDNAEAGRVWIEQTGASRGNSSFVIISSSQAGPMLMPYVASGQVTGLVNGLNDAAKVESANGQSESARRDWDAYSAGLLLAAVMIVFGGLWNLAVGLQARRAEKEEG